MTFDPSLPDEGVNVSHSRPLREAALLLAGVLAGGALLVVVIGSAVDLLVPRLPPTLEMKLFALPWPSGLVGEEREESAAYAEKVEELLGRLVQHWRDNPYRFRVGIWQEEQPNALAFPGGWMVVTSGLLERVESENELAFVLGHELGHFRNRDHLRGLGRGLAFALVMTAVGAAGAGSATEFAAAAGELAERGFDRDQERDADLFGLELVAAEYGHVAGATDFFERIPEPVGESEKRIAHYLATHPLNEDRILALRGTAEERGWSSTGELEPAGLD